MNEDILHSTKYNNIDPTKFYDTIIDFDSLKISCEEKGFKILFSENGYKNYEKRKKQNSTIVGVIGNANKGKSYILSKISNEELPRGYSVSTKGISVKYPKIEIRPFIILDSAGSETPLIKNSDNEYINESNNVNFELINELARDKIATQNFIQDFIYFYSNILIIIVGQLTNDEQKLINKIKLIYGNKKIIFIIHNLMFIETIKNVETIIENIIKKSITFNKLSKRNIISENDDRKNNYYYLEAIDDKSTIVHLIMAREGTEAGNYYNQSTIDFLKKQIITETITKNFDVIESFKEYLSMSSGTYMENPIEINDIEYDNIEKKIKIQTEEEIIIKKCFINEIGILNFYGKVIEPSYDYKQYEGRMEVMIELPGITNDDNNNNNKNNTFLNSKLNVGGGNYIFTYHGNIKLGDNVDNQDPSRNINLLFGNFEESEYRLQLTFAISDGLIKSSKPKKKIDEKNGLITLIYEYAEPYDAEEIML